MRLIYLRVAKGHNSPLCWLRSNFFWANCPRLHKHKVRTGATEGSYESAKGTKNQELGSVNIRHLGIEATGTFATSSLEWKWSTPRGNTKKWLLCLKNEAWTRQSDSIILQHQIGKTIETKPLPFRALRAPLPGSAILRPVTDTDDTVKSGSWSMWGPHWLAVSFMWCCVFFDMLFFVFFLAGSAFIW